MRRKMSFAACCLALFATASAQAVIPSPLPPIKIVLEPNSPDQIVDMRVSGTWPDSCRPAAIEVSIGAGPTLWVDLILSSFFDPNCPPANCIPGNTGWEVLLTPAGPFPAGLYRVYARAIDCDAVGPYELAIRRFLIGPGGNGQPPDGAFARGQRVVLLQDDPINDLRAGQAGTIVCCDGPDCAGRVLVSWDLRTGAKDDTTGCVDLPVPLFPIGSTTWVDPHLLAIGRPFNQCGTIRRDLEGCVLFEADNGKSYTVISTSGLYGQLDTPGGFEFGQRVRLRGLLDTAIPKPDIITICPVRDGDVYHPILSRCAPTPAGCCGGQLFPGDRVTLLVDNPVGPNGRGAPGLMAGTAGTVICCEGPYGPSWVFVSWDGWTDGINADVFCGSTVIPYVRDSGWWVPCDRIALGDGGNGGAGDGFVVRFAGNVIRLEPDPTAPNPQRTLVGCTTATVQSNSRVQLGVEVTAASAAGGTWSGTVTPAVINAGTTVVEICVRGENVDLTQVPPGANRQLASLSLFAVPLP